MNGPTMLERARAMVGERPYFRPEDYDDLVATVALALVERSRGRHVDPALALRRERSRQRAWSNVAFLSPIAIGEGDWHGSGEDR